MRRLLFFPFLLLLLLPTPPVSPQPRPPIRRLDQSQLTPAQEQRLAEAEKLLEQGNQLYQQGKYEEAIAMEEKAL